LRLGALSLAIRYSAAIHQGWFAPPCQQPPVLFFGQEAYHVFAPAITLLLRGIEYRLRSEHLANETVPLTANASAEVREIYGFLQ